MPDHVCHFHIPEDGHNQGYLKSNLQLLFTKMTRTVEAYTVRLSYHISSQQHSTHKQYTSTATSAWLEKDTTSHSFATLLNSRGWKFPCYFWANSILFFGTFC